MPPRLLSIEFFDVGRFGRQFVDLSGDAVCVVGPNGAGKTTVVAGLYFALTGDLTRLGRRDGAAAVTRSAPDQQPYVRLTLSPTGAAGDVATVTRWLADGPHKARRRLVHADRVLTSDDDVTAACCRWLGMPPAAVADFVFVAQGRMAAVVEDPPAKRAEVLSKLFAVDSAERARAALVDAAKALPAQPDPALVAAARARAAEAAAEVDALDRRLSALPVYPPDVVAGAHAVVAAARRREALLPSLKAAEARAASALAAVKAGSPTPPAGPPAADLERAAAAWAAYRADAARHAGALAAADRLEAEAAAVPRPPAPGPRPVRPPADNLTLYQAIAECRPGETCPVCRQAVPGGLDVTRAAAEADAIIEAVQAWEKADAEWEMWAEAARGYERTVTGLRQRAAATRAAAGEAPTPPGLPEPPPGAAAAAAAAWSAYTRAAARYDEAVKSLPAAEEEVAALTARVPADVGAADVAAAAGLIEAAAAAVAEKARLTGEAAAARRAVAAHQRVIEAADAAEATAATAEGWRGVLEGAAAVLHRDAAPAAVVRDRLAGLTAAVNAAAARLGADFTVTLGEAGELVPSRNGRQVPRLSGGQTAVLALAWRMALSPGLMCLDEPTYGLDDERIDRLRAAVEAWRDAKTGGQLIVVTHERRLVGAFDRVIELTA